MRRTVSFALVALLSHGAHGQVLDSETCSALPELIDREVEELPEGTAYVEFARTTDESTVAPEQRSDPGDFFQLALWLNATGRCHIQGLAENADPVSGRRHLRAASLLGDQSADYPLAAAMVFEPINQAEAARGTAALRVQMEAGSDYAAGALGWAYRIGSGVPQDDAEALRLFEQAATGGMTLWQFLLAHVYEQGYFGVPVDPDKAQYWKDFPLKVHVYTYECAVSLLYQGGMSFPENSEMAADFAERCEQ